MFASGFAPYAASENLVNAKLALAMVRGGWDVEVVSAADEGFTYRIRWEEPWLDLMPHTHQVRYEHRRAIPRFFERARFALELGHPIAGVRWAHAALRIAFDLHRSKAFDFVMSRSVSDFAHLPAISFRERTGVPWLANWNDPPAFLFPPPYRYGGAAWKKSLWIRYYRACLRCADYHTFPCERLARHMLSSLGAPDSVRWGVVPHVALADYVPVREEQGPRFSLCHAGNLSAERDPRPFLSALRRVARSLPSTASIRFDVLGVEDVNLSRLVAEQDLQEIVSFKGGRSYLETLRHVASSDVAVLIEAPCSEGVFLPSKLVDYAQAGTPILALSPSNGTVRDLLSSHGGGLWADCASPGGIEQALRLFSGLWQRRELDRLRPSSLLEECRPQRVLSFYDSTARSLAAKRATHDSRTAICSSGTADRTARDGPRSRRAELSSGSCDGREPRNSRRCGSSVGRA